MIRPESSADAPAVAALVTEAFGRTDEAVLAASLHASGDAAIALVACAGAAIVGHIVFSPMTAPLPALGLAPLAVTPNHQGAGIGAALVREGLARAATAGWRAVFVFGDPAYYRRFGFSAALAGGFDSPYAGPHLMVLPLAGTLPVTTGAIGYAPAFSAL